MRASNMMGHSSCLKILENILAGISPNTCPYFVACRLAYHASLPRLQAAMKLGVFEWFGKTIGSPVLDEWRLAEAVSRLILPRATPVIHSPTLTSCLHQRALLLLAVICLRLTVRKVKEVETSINLADDGVVTAAPAFLSHSQKQNSGDSNELVSKRARINDGQGVGFGFDFERVERESPEDTPENVERRDPSGHFVMVSPEEVLTFKVVLRGHRCAIDFVERAVKETDLGANGLSLRCWDKIAQGLGDLHHASSSVQAEFISVHFFLMGEISCNLLAGKRLKEMRVRLGDVRTLFTAREKACMDILAENQVLRVDLGKIEGLRSEISALRGDLARAWQEASMCRADAKKWRKEIESLRAHLEDTVENSKEADETECQANRMAEAVINRGVEDAIIVNASDPTVQTYVADPTVHTDAINGEDPGDARA
ncbi:uncharacterized protein G2W53_008237 [Senna tora]|uniref:Uncharacterized protein n=1 Tax=Senna tora TaxID=362788 RepID=A0A834X827_9FABA|nr:uncharacterized protein G2W53_008237 [Senna tora]